MPFSPFRHLEAETRERLATIARRTEHFSPTKQCTFKSPAPGHGFEPLTASASGDCPSTTHVVPANSFSLSTHSRLVRFPLLPQPLAGLRQCFGAMVQRAVPSQVIAVGDITEVPELSARWMFNASICFRVFLSPGPCDITSIYATSSPQRAVPLDLSSPPSLRSPAGPTLQELTPGSCPLANTTLLYPALFAAHNWSTPN